MNGQDFTKGVLVGAIAGAIGGVLFAPKSGKETRKDLQDRFNDIKEDVIHELQKTNEFRKDLYDQAVNRTVARYEMAKKITPDDAKKVREIFEKSYKDIEKIVSKDLKKVKEAGKAD